MIKCIIINSCSDEFVPDDSSFNKWISAFDYNTQAEVTIKIVDENEMRNFNILYRNQDKISDTLAFPANNLQLNETLLLGDIAMCAKKINSDSKHYSKEKIERWAHLTIHSMLHILGYDHNSPENQNKMEDIEIELLKKFNIPDPYTI
tara:strand:+ start:190 stop:633 length:444 start_codon:yes stop_codon:yes gene_type:complete